VERVTLVDSPASDAAKAPAPGTIAKGQTITVTIPQLVGPGIEKVNVVKVADDGTITLPMIDPLPVAGETVGELQQRVADKYREANLINDATVTAVIAASPATQFAMAKATTEPAKDMATSKQAPLAAAVAAPATQPASDLVDVVVVIQPSRFAAPATPAGPPVK
jgi:protein involved in polysaccharide export with SLBB domain